METTVKETLVQETPKKKSPARLLILAAVMLIGGYFGIRAYFYNQHHIKTDNAQLDASITSVRSAVSGFVREVRFTDNQRVRKGDTLVIIDSKDYVAKVMEARAMLQSAETQTGVSRVSAQAASQNAAATTLNASSLQSSIDAARARLNKAEKEVDRAEKMFIEGAVTQQQVDAVRAEYQGARAQHEQAMRQYQATNTQSSSVQTGARAQREQVGVSNALVQQRLAELQLAESQLGYTVIVAPFDGIVSKKAAEVGQLLQIGQPICSAVASANIWVTANFKETQLERMQLGQKVNIELDAYPSLKLTGTVESIGAATGNKFSLFPSDNATGNFVKVTQRIPVRIKLDKTGNIKYTLQPGLSANVEIETN
jgi:membrane fusion protein (multidrug efflux system)